MADRARVLIVEDDRFIAQDAANVLRQAGYEVLAPVFAADDAERAAAEGRPDVALVDIVLDENKDGVALAEHLGTRFGLPFVFLTAHADGPTMDRAMEAAPHGYVVKPFLPNQLIATIAAAISRARIEANAPSGRMRAAEALPAPAERLPIPGYELLTKREHDVIRALRSGRRIRGIAEQMGLSPHTVRNHVKSILFKLSVHSQDELVRLVSEAESKLSTL